MIATKKKPLPSPKLEVCVGAMRNESVPAQSFWRPAFVEVICFTRRAVIGIPMEAGCDVKCVHVIYGDDNEAPFFAEEM